MTAARSRRAGRGRKVTQEIKRGTTRTGAMKARALSEGRSKLELKAPQTGTSRKAMRDAPKPKQEIKRGTTRTRQPRVEKEVVPGTTRVRKTADGSKKTKPTLNKQGAAAFAKALDEAGKRKAAKKATASKVTAGSTSSKTTTTAKPGKKKDKEKKTLFGLEIKPSSRFAGKGGKGRRVAGRAMGGMMKSKMASKGGAKGGKRMPPGMKAGGSASKFPDLSGDGKVTQKDILMGKGVIKKQAGGMMKSKMSSKGGAKGGRKPGGMRRGGMARSPLARARRGAGGGPVAGAANMQRLAKQALKGFGGGGGFQSQAGGKPALQGGAGGFQSQAGGLAAQQAAGAQAAQAAGGRRRRRQAGGPSGGRMGAMAGMGGAMPQQQLTAQFMANGGMAKKKPKGYAKGGASTKKGYSKGGSVRGRPRGVGAAMRGFGKALKK